jgi:tetratricopeptide (TPR) repeat protein
LRQVFGNLVPLILLSALVCEEGGAQFLPISATAPNETNSVGQLITHARASLEHGDFEGERAALEQALKLEPTHKQARLALTDSFMRLGRWEEADSQAQVLVRQFPADAEPVFLLAVIALRRGDPRKANELAARCLARGDAQSEVYKVLALSGYLLHDTSQFEANIRSVLEKNPRDAEALYFLARYLFEVKRYSESLECFQRVIELEPDHYRAHYYVGLLHVAGGEADLARAEFEASIKIVESKRIGYAWPYAEIGRASSDAGDTVGAMGWLSRGIRNDPTCPKTYYEYARVLFQKGATPEVKQALLEAVHLDPGYTEAYYLLARYYRKSGEAQTAAQVLAKFRDLKSHPIPSPYGLPRQ